MCEWKRRIQSERKGEYTIQNFTQKEKRSDLMGSKQANEINNSNKESKAESTGNDKEGQDPFFLCEVEEEGFKEAKESTKRKNGGGSNQHPWNSEKRSKQQE